MQPKQIIILTIFVLVMAAGIIYLQLSQNDNQTGSKQELTNANIIECDRDSDCMAGGCSKTVCLPRDQASATVTTCEWQDKYACYAKDSCGCRDHQCQWAGNEQYLNCLNGLN